MEAFVVTRKQTSGRRDSGGVIGIHGEGMSRGGVLLILYKWGHFPPNIDSIYGTNPLKPSP